MKTEKEDFELVVKTFKGLEGVLAEELKAIGARDIKVLNRAVSFRGDNRLLYKANLWLRTALKILKPVHTFKAKNEVEFYKGMSQIEWDQFISVDHNLAINTMVASQYFHHSHYIALKAKDAIVDQFRAKFNKRPSIDTENPDILLNVHLTDDECVVSMDSSGESLHKRGYRLNSTIAPVNEALAAGMILLSGWNGKTNFLDPMCGSGTLPIEAALIAYNIPPGIFRKEFGFEKWKDFDPDLFEEIYNEDENATEFHHQIVGSDISAGAIRIASENLKNACLSNKVKLEVKAFESLIPQEGGGTIIMNPPYGERIKKNNIQEFYQSIGNSLKRNFRGFEVWMLSGNKDALDLVGLHPSQKLTLFNGAIECKFQKFEIYEGSKKIRKTV